MYHVVDKSTTWYSNLDKAINTTQKEKLQEMSVSISTISNLAWISDNLTREVVICETGQCCVWFGDVQYRSSTEDFVIAHISDFQYNPVMPSTKTVQCLALVVMAAGGGSSTEHYLMIS